MTPPRWGLALLLWLAFVPAMFGQTNADGESDLPSAKAKASDTNAPFFFYDHPDETIHAAVLDNPLFYDAGVAPTREGLWMAWMELVPGKGDLLWMGLRGTNGWVKKTLVQSTPGDFANPTPIVDTKGRVWLSYEAGNKNGRWDILLQQWNADDTLSPPQKVNTGDGVAINHQVAPDPVGGLWFVWQDDNKGQFDILSRRISGAYVSQIFSVSTSPQNDWEPSLTVGRNGNMNIVWDGYDGTNYQIFGRGFDGVKWSDVARITSGTTFQAHAQVNARPHGPVWMLWEEDGENWGQTYRARTPGDALSTKLSDKIGPLHRFRKLKLDEFGASSIRHIEIPMPSLKLAAARTNAPPDVKYTGAFYEDGRLTVDGMGRLWITYRHFYTPWVGVVPEHHKQDSWILYARCLLDDRWSKLYSFDIGQGDGMQRLMVVPKEDGITAVWTTGRMDRRKTDKPLGIAMASISLPNDAKGILPVVSFGENLNLPDPQPAPAPQRARPAMDFAGKHYELFFGDLHRHTDISLCFSPSDGSIDDAYRYAIDAAPLDFLGITDHTHDLAMGDELSLIWWRSRKEVNRHQLKNTFIPFYAYERSRADTDHNVISLRDDILRPHTYPITQFWAELDTNTFTIPHQPFNRILWNYKDDVHRPLLEIYQGFRNNTMEKPAKEGLLRGHKFGIIASSDHLSTDASFACVWSEKTDREGVFRSMQARRTYGATAKIVLKVTCGEHWMGESFETNVMPPIHVEVHGTAPITSCDILVDGDVKESLPDDGKSADGKFSWYNKPPLTGPHIFYVRINQADGNHAWSSPFWVDIKP